MFLFSEEISLSFQNIPFLFSAQREPTEHSHPLLCDCFYFLTFTQTIKNVVIVIYFQRLSTAEG